MSKGVILCIMIIIHIASSSVIQRGSEGGRLHCGGSQMRVIFVSQTCQYLGPSLSFPPYHLLPSLHGEWVNGWRWLQGPSMLSKRAEKKHWQGIRRRGAKLPKSAAWKAAAIFFLQHTHWIKVSGISSFLEHAPLSLWFLLWLLSLIPLWCVYVEKGGPNCDKMSPLSGVSSCWEIHVKPPSSFFDLPPRC